mgnify:CR=1 FL=1
MRPDRDTVVELLTDPELARIEREFHESQCRLERLLYESAEGQCQ